MTVQEIKDKLPEAAVYELRPEARYLIVLDRNFVASSVGQLLGDRLSDDGVHATIIVVDNAVEAVRLLELQR